VTGDGETDVDPEAEPASKEPASTDAELQRERERIEVEKGRASLHRHQDDLGLRKRVANGALIAMIVQIGLADAGFYLYGDGNHWRIPAMAIEGWLAATVIQVVSVVLVITRYLFPGGGPRE
jgi:hypothetical protein